MPNTMASIRKKYKNITVTIVVAVTIREKKQDF